MKLQFLRYYKYILKLYVFLIKYAIKHLTVEIMVDDILIFQTELF